MLARVKQLETCNREMFGDVIVTCQAPQKSHLSKIESAYIPPLIFENTAKRIQWKSDNEKRRASLLVDQLLSEIYARIGSASGSNTNSDCNSVASSRSCRVCRLDEKSLWEKGECCLIY